MPISSIAMACWPTSTRCPRRARGLLRAVRGLTAKREFWRGLRPLPISMDASLIPASQALFDAVRISADDLPACRSALAAPKRSPGPSVTSPHPSSLHAPTSALHGRRRCAVDDLEDLAKVEDAACCFHHRPRFSRSTTDAPFRRSRGGLSPRHGATTIPRRRRRLSDPPGQRRPSALRKIAGPLHPQRRGGPELRSNASDERWDR